MISETKATRPKAVPLHELFLNDLQPNGYRAGLPPWSDPENTDLDKAAAETSTCDACGEVGQIYWPTHNPDSRGYRCFTRCPECGHCSEF